MRNVFFALLVWFGVLAVYLWIACTLASPQHGAQLHNAYWPFSVETSVHDR